MSSGSKPMRPAISSLEGLVPSLKRARSRCPFLVGPPFLADLALEVGTQLSRADPGAQVVGRVEAGVHVGQVALLAVAHPGRRRKPLGVARRGAAVLAEASPELELELELRHVTPEEQRLHEDRRLGVLGGLLVRRGRSSARASRAAGRSPRRCTSRSPSARGRGRCCGRCTAASDRSPRSAARAPPRAGTPGSRGARPVRA